MGSFGITRESSSNWFPGFALKRWFWSKSMGTTGYVGLMGSLGPWAWRLEPHGVQWDLMDRIIIPDFPLTRCKSLLQLLKFAFGPAQPRCCFVNVFDVVNTVVSIVVSYVGNVTEYRVSYCEYSLSHKCIQCASMSRDVLFLPWSS